MNGKACLGAHKGKDGKEYAATVCPCIWFRSKSTQPEGGKK